MFIDYPYEIEMIADEEEGIVETLIAYYHPQLTEALLNICASNFPDKWIGAYRYPPNGGREEIGERDGSAEPADVLVALR